MESLAIISDMERECGQHAKVIFGHFQSSLQRYLAIVQDHVKQKKDLVYLDTTSCSGVFSIAKFTSFSQCNEHNTSIATDGDYLYIYVAVPQKAVMYKVGTGSASNTIPGKIYLEKKAERDGDVAWTYCQGKLFARRASEEFGVLTIYDSETLTTIGDARLMANDVFNSSNGSQYNKSCPILSDGKRLYVVTMKVVQKRRPVKPECKQIYNQLQLEKKKALEKDPPKRPDLKCASCQRNCTLLKKPTGMSHSCNGGCKGRSLKIPFWRCSDCDWDCCEPCAEKKLAPQIKDLELARRREIERKLSEV
jgi:hypothetical protein